MALCLDMFMAGSETTNNSISFGMMYLVLNPDVQKKAQEEIDRVLGGRPATMDDRTKLVQTYSSCIESLKWKIFSMPYMEGVMLESIRMFTSKAFSIPHRALRDTYLGGYRIPKVINVLSFENLATLLSAVILTMLRFTAHVQSVIV